MLNIKLCRTYESAKKIAKELAPCGAIECEYGDKVIDENIEGVKVAMYHHGKHSDKPAPSVRWDVYESLEKGLDNFIISHIDLDTIMGIMWASKILKPTSIAKEIGKLTEIQDLKGFHYVEKNILHTLKPTLKYRFLGVGYIVANIEKPKLTENIIDVSKPVHKSILKIKDIIIDGVNEELKEQIDNWLKTKEEDALSAQVIFDPYYKIRIFQSEKNLLSAYNLKNQESIINIQFNTANGAITASVQNEELAKEIFGEQGIITPLRKVFGEDAGGRVSVGGAPREKTYSLDDAFKLYKEIKKYFTDKTTRLIDNEII